MPRKKVSSPMTIPAIGLMTAQLPAEAKKELKAAKATDEQVYFYCLGYMRGQGADVSGSPVNRRLNVRAYDDPWPTEGLPPDPHDLVQMRPAHALAPGEERDDYPRVGEGEVQSLRAAPAGPAGEPSDGRWPYVLEPGALPERLQRQIFQSVTKLGRPDRSAVLMKVARELIKRWGKSGGRPSRWVDVVHRTLLERGLSAKAEAPAVTAEQANQASDGVPSIAEGGAPGDELPVAGAQNESIEAGAEPIDGGSPGLFV